MIRDRNNAVSNSQAIQATGASTDVWDTGLTGGGISNGKTLFALFTVNTAANAWTSIDLDIQTAIASTFGSPISVVKYSTILQATLAAGYQLAIPLPPGTCKRYLRGYYTGNGSGASDTLAVTLEFVEQVDSKQLVTYTGA